MIHRKRMYFFSICLWLSFFCCGSAVAQQSATPISSKNQFTRIDPTAIPDVIMTNEHGQEVRFLSDVLRSRVVVINTIFTTCTTICPPMGANFAKLEKLLGSRAGREVLLVSISLDPINDTPERLRAWSAKFGAGSGWTLLTGPKQNVDAVLKAIGVFIPDKVQHTSTTLVGRAETGQWLRASGLARASQLQELVNQILEQHAVP